MRAPTADLATRLRQKLKIPVMAGPMFIASTPELVIAQCRSGIIGAMPALNPRTSALLDADIARIKHELAGCDVPYAINLVAHTWARANLREGDAVVVTEMEHHANVVPWHMLAEERGIELRWIPLTDDYRLDTRQRAFLLSLGETIYGGTSQIQRNIIGEQVLGLPKDPRP